MPVAVIPFVARQVVAAVEDLAKGDVAELGDGEEGGRFHLHNETALGFALGNFALCFAEDAVGCPGFADAVGDVVFGEGGLDGGYGRCRCGNFAAGW